MMPVLSIATGTWSHLAVVRSGNTWFAFQDGSQIGSKTCTSAMPDSTGPLHIASDYLGGEALNGWLDEFRISKGVARWTTNFTPATARYDHDSSTVLLLHMDGANGSTTFTDDVNTTSSSSSQTTTTGSSSTTTTSSPVSVSITVAANPEAQ